MKRYLLCELNDENYTDAFFRIFNILSSATNTAILDCINEYCGNCQVETNDLRIASSRGDSFYVAEIKEFEEHDGTHLLVWHHAYKGVGFEIRYQGTYEECKMEMEREMEMVLNEYHLPDEAKQFDNVIDTGNEWEVWDIVEIGV